MPPPEAFKPLFAPDNQQAGGIPGLGRLLGDEVLGEIVPQHPTIIAGGAEAYREMRDGGLREDQERLAEVTLHKESHHQHCARP